MLLGQLARGHSTGVAAFWGILTALLVSWIRPANRMGPSQIWGALVDGTRNTLMIASVAGSIGIIVGVIGLTGLGLRFSGIMLSLTGESLFLAMLIVALTATVLGCGAPITATYVILAVLVPPALATLGVSVEAAHFTLIWFSQLSSITPPVCLVVYAAAAIAQADPFRTSYHAMKFSAFLVVMPFLSCTRRYSGADPLDERARRGDGHGCGRHVCGHAARPFRESEYEARDVAACGRHRGTLRWQTHGQRCRCCAGGQRTSVNGPLKFGSREAAVPNSTTR